jgi:hypothetical protein
MKETIIVSMQNEKHQISGQRVFSYLLLVTLLTYSVLQGNIPLISSAMAADQKMYVTPEAAVEDLVASLVKDDMDSLLNIFGRQHEKKLIGGDPVASRANRKLLYQEAQNMHKLRDDGDGRKILLIGAKAWPLPFPLVEEGKNWRFDTEAGIEEAINRRVGRNELSAIETCHAYIDAQVEYASVDRDGDQVLEYAQHFASTEGNKDGLYWEAAENEELSPFGPLVADAADYLEGRDPGDPFKGYYYKIIPRQGSSAVGGRYDYLINGNMIAGFALIAFPADYGNSGIVTFVCSHQGKVYQKNLGEDSDLIAAGIDEFNPDASWSEVKE